MEPNDRCDLTFLIRESREAFAARIADPVVVTPSRLAEYRRCPALTRRRELGLIREPQEGHPAHEQAVVDQVLAAWMTSGKLGPDRIAAANEPDPPGGERLEQMARAALTHPSTRELLQVGVADGVIQCDVDGHRCCARADWINPGRGCGLIDFAFCFNLDSFECLCEVSGRLHRIAFIRDLIARASGFAMPVHIIAIEQSEPFRAGVWRVADRMLDRVHRDNTNAMRSLAKHRETGVWPDEYSALKRLDRKW